ncbi:MAG: hypothetical protein M3Z14_01820 [Candidatus Eremiobacteraeota bacterium]|nr:hypothetical protein [Candidatus Eremiobacteraeota bacterium]
MISAEYLTAIASVGTFIVVGGTAVAALIQLRHLRASNQLDALLSLERDFRSPEMQSALCYVQKEIAARLSEEHYRAELAALGFIDAQAHPEITVCNWFNAIGTLVKNGLVGEATFMDLFGKLISYYWRILVPVIALMRRNRGDAQYHDFEFLAIRADQWVKMHPHGLFPKNMQRALIDDPWKE